MRITEGEPFVLNSGEEVVMNELGIWPSLNDQERWQTPPEVWEPLNEEFRFDLDAFADEQTKRLPRYLTDALGPQDWPGERIFMNPPYGRKLVPCVRRGYQEAAKGKIVVAVIPLRYRGDWAHDVVVGKALEVRPVRMRVSFIRPDGSRGEHTGSCDTQIVVWNGPGPHETVLRSFFQRFNSSDGDSREPQSRDAAGGDECK